jgi:LPXTG-site transpeptidase (sortase) family protein
MDKTRIVKHRRTINLAFRTVGNTFIILALFFLGLGFWPYISSEARYNWNQIVGQKFYVQGDKAQKPAPAAVPLVPPPPPLSIAPVNTDFSLVIPKIDLSAYVTIDVNAADYSDYSKALTKGAAHAKGTVYPGQDGNSYIFAHSSLNFWDIARYNSVFTLLRKMEVGDLIAVFYKGQRYDYYVTEKKVVSPSQIDLLTPMAQGKQLTLQTCDPPGLNLNRLVVIAKIRN